MVIGVLIIFGLLILFLVGMYNSLVVLRNRCDNGWAQVDVQLRRRYDLIPNLVETVKGYAAHEKGVLESVTAARTRAMAAGGSPLEKAKSEDQLSGTLKTLFAVAENYPQLKANENFLELQRELTDTEDKMMAARRFYNSTVRDLNIAVQTFPTNLLANLFGFHSEKFFEAANDAERQAVQVKF